MNKKLQKSSSSVQLVIAFCLSHDLFCASTRKGPVIFPRAPLWWPSRSPWAILPSGLHHVPCHIPFLALLLYFAAHLIFYLLFFTWRAEAIRLSNLTVFKECVFLGKFRSDPGSRTEPEEGKGAPLQAVRWRRESNPSNNHAGPSKSGKWEGG